MRKTLTEAIENRCQKAEEHYAVSVVLKWNANGTGTINLESGSYKGELTVYYNRCVVSSLRQITLQDFEVDNAVDHFILLVKCAWWLRDLISRDLRLL